MRDRLDGVSVFVATVEAGGFAKAADRLALTRSAVAKAIARLEMRLGVRLFHRTTRSHSLTEDGQIYFGRCLRAIEELRQGEALISSAQNDVSGKLKVTMPVLFGRYCIQPLLLDLALAHPRLELDLRFSDSLVDLIAEGYDLGLRIGSPGESAVLRTRKLATHRMTLCAAPAYLDGRTRPQSIANLADHEALVHRLNDNVYPWLFQLPTGPVQAPVKWRLQFDNYEAIADASLKGIGIAYLPSWMARAHIETGRLLSLLEDYPSISFNTYAVWPANRFIPLRLRAAIDLLADGLQGQIDGS